MYAEHFHSHYVFTHMYILWAWTLYDATINL